MYSLSSRDYFFLIFKGKLPKGNNPGFIAHHFFTEDTFSLLETKLSVASGYNLLPGTLVTFIKETRVNALMRGSYWNPYGCTHPGKDCRDISDKRLASNILEAIFAVIGESAILSSGMFNKKFKETRVNALMRGSYWNPYGCTHPGKDCRDISDKRLASNILEAIFAVIGESAILSSGMFNKKFRICLKPVFYYEKVSKFRISKKPPNFAGQLKYKLCLKSVWCVINSKVVTLVTWLRDTLGTSLAPPPRPIYFIIM